jgi:serine/threonine-protein phosphatase 2B catalytic subunit
VRDHLAKEGRVAKEEVIRLVRMADKVFKNEANLLHLQDPLTIVGDIHG